MTSVQEMPSNQNSWFWWSVKEVKGHTCFVPEWAVMRNDTWSLQQLLEICSEIKYPFQFRCFQRNVIHVGDAEWINHYSSCSMPSFNEKGWRFMSALALWVNIWEFPFEFEKLFHGTDICQNMWGNYGEVFTQTNISLCVCNLISARLWSVRVWIILCCGLCSVIPFHYFILNATKKPRGPSILSDINNYMS